MLNNYVCTLDIGSNKIAGCVARIKRGKPQDIFFDSVLSKGVREGVIVDSAELLGAVTRILSRLKSKSGINIKLLYVNISGSNVTTKHSRSIIPLIERGNKVITSSDIAKVVEQARILGMNLEEEIIHSIPFGYSIDSKDGIINPLGLYSHRLEVDLYLISAKLSSVQSLARVINQAGCEIKEIIFSGIATAEAVFNKEFLTGNNLLCDIGSDITELILFENGSLRDVQILSLGGDNLTAQLMTNLKIPFELAEDIKRSYGIVGEPEHISADKEILVRKEGFYNPIKHKTVSEIATEKTKEICRSIAQTIEKKIRFYEVNNFIIAGRAILLEGFIETMENILNVPVKTGRITANPLATALRDNSDLSGHKYLTYLTCIGMLSIALQKACVKRKSSLEPAGNLFSKALARIKEVYQEYF